MNLYWIRLVSEDDDCGFNNNDIHICCGVGDGVPTVQDGCWVY